MTAAQLRAILDRLGLSQVGAARFLDVDDRTVRRWIAGDIAVPRPVEMLLRLLDECPAAMRHARKTFGLTSER
jgi:DNA-binding transcriptional regulator YiaG